MEKNSKKFVLDTNVILHDGKAIRSFEENDIIVPIQVLTELDKFKKGNDVINFNAREFIRLVDSFSPEKLFDGGASLGNGLGKIRIVHFPQIHPKVKDVFKEDVPDHQIINAVYCLVNSEKEEDKNSRFIFVSKDINLRMKAKFLGLEAEDYKTDAVPNIQSLYEEARTIMVDSEVIDSLFENGKINSSGSHIKIEENEFIILNSNSSQKSALAFYSEGLIYFLRKERIFGITPKNAEQVFLMNALLNPKITLVTAMGKAGTGKTLISLAAGLNNLHDNIYEELYFTRKIIGMGNEDPGILPGDPIDKVRPYMQGMYDNLSVISSSDSHSSVLIDEYKRQTKVIIEPLAYIRGRSLNNKFFIIDETQNLTPNELKTIITRAGEGTKIVLLGDIYQIDSPYLDQRSNGLSYVISRMKGQDFYAHVNLLKGERSHMSEVAGDLL